VVTAKLWCNKEAQNKFYGTVCYMVKILNCKAQKASENGKQNMNNNLKSTEHSMGNLIGIN